MMPLHRPNILMPFRFVIAIIVLIASGVAIGGFTEPDDAQSETQNIKDSNALDECVITFVGGRRLTGLLMDSSDELVVLRINGIDTTYRRSRIESIQFLPPIAERYANIRALTPENDIEARLLLVDWLRDRQAYELAVEELESILEHDPNNRQAKLLKTWLEEHLKLTKQRSTEETTKVSPRNRRVERPSIPLLTEEQVNLIRVYEIDLADPPKLIVEDATIRELIARDPGSFPTDEKEREKIFDWPDIEKLKLLFRHKARDLYPEVRVLEDPQSFVDFKDLIAGRSGWLINGCATMRCHGGPDSGNLQLSYQNPNSPESLYTNFLIIDNFKMKDGSALINHTDPERSPLLHMGLVRSRSLNPHPDVDKQALGRDWRAVFRSTNASNFKRATEWIRSLYTPRPDYGIEYPPPPPPSSPDSTEQDSKELAP